MKGFLRFLHWVILINFIAGFVYAGYMAFSVTGIHTPLFGRIKDIPFELGLYRRLYAIEGWLIFIGFALYLGLTEILPRKLPRGGRNQNL
jgi:hypothetical protein